MSKIHIYGGGTFSYVRNHLALCAPAFGTTAKKLKQLMHLQSDLHLTKMADSSSKLATNEDVLKHIEYNIQRGDVKWIVLNAALCDFNGKIGGQPSGKNEIRLNSRKGPYQMDLMLANKIVREIKAKHPKIKILAFKTTTGADILKQIKKSLKMEVDLVIANDILTRRNIIVYPDKTFFGGERNQILEMASSYIKHDISSKSLIKNSRYSNNFVTYSVEVKRSTDRKDAFNRACEILESEGLQGDWIDSKWNMYHQNIYLVSKKIGGIK